MSSGQGLCSESGLCFAAPADRQEPPRWVRLAGVLFFASEEGYAAASPSDLV